MEATNNGTEVVRDLAIAASNELNRVAAVDAEGLLVAPKSFDVVDLERYMPNRRRFRGAFGTTSIDDFAEYVSAEAGVDGRNGVRGFIDPDTLTARVIFNLGTDEKPGHADHTAALQLKPTAAYAAALAVDGIKGTQRTLIDWIEDWAPHITAVDENANAMTIPQLVAALREVKVRAKREATHVEEDRRAARSAMEEVEADFKGAWPARIHFACTPYNGLPSVELVYRVAVLTEREEPGLVLRCIGKETLVEGVVESFKRVLNEKLQAAELDLVVGTYKA